jgi:geranylgeranyl pyrophosphate synthase
MRAPSAWPSRWWTTSSTPRPTSATLGKTAGKDAADNKPTYVSILGLAESQALAEKLRGNAHAALAPFGEKARACASWPT